MRTLYNALTDLDKDGAMIFMNYGYAELKSGNEDLVLNPEDLQNRYCIQLYHRVVAAVGVEGKRVLEIGSGRGGGASYVARYLKPESLIGVDLSPKAAKFCNRHYVVRGLSFQQGDSENLPFADGSFDVAVNVESSHAYGSVPRFLKEVHRVLKSDGGRLAFTDHRTGSGLEELRAQFRAAGLVVLSEEDITANVLKALELDDVRKRELIRRLCPKWLQGGIDEFAAMKGTKAFEEFRSLDSLYLRFVLRKEGGS